MNRIFFLLTILSVSTIFSLENWIDRELEESFSLSQKKEFSARELWQYFEELSQKNIQTLYCKVEGKRVSLYPSRKTDSLRNKVIDKFLNRLVQKRELPSIDFILVTEDEAPVYSHLPVFAFAKESSSFNVFLIPDFEIYEEIMNPQGCWRGAIHKLSQNYPWEKKTSRIYFRGTSTGYFFNHDPGLSNQRLKAVWLSTLYPEILDAKFSKILQPQIQILANQLKQSVEFVPIAKQLAYKYLLDIDGYSSAYGRPRWILFSNSLLIKLGTTKKQWYYKALEPWRHYVPLKYNFSDLLSIFHWLEENEDKSRQIALEGKALAEKIFSEKMVEEYLLALFKQYQETFWQQK